MRLLLASASPRRAELLAAAGYRFDTLAVDIDETVSPGEAAAAYVRRLALEKSARAQAILAIEPSRAPTGPIGVRMGQKSLVGPGAPGQVEMAGRPGHARLPGQTEVALPAGSAGDEFSGSDSLIVLGADTVVVVDGEILGKPVDRADAERMLRRVSGRRHDVMTGLSLRRNEMESGGVETTGVYFMTLSEADVAWYCASGEGRDKAGGYAIQGLASRFVTRIEGSYSNVVGLPVAVVFSLLQRLASSG